MNKRIKSVDIAIVATLLLLAALLLIPRFTSSGEQTAAIADADGDGRVTLADYSGKKIGSITGANYDTIVDRRIPGATIEYYGNYPDLVVALKAGLIDAFIIDEPALDVIMAEDPSIGKLPEPLDTWQMTFAFSDKSAIAGLPDQMNAFIRMIRENGDLKKIGDIWFGSDDSVKVIPPLQDLSAENGTVRVALETTYAPIVYIRGRQIVGYEVDILYRFCAFHRYGLQLMDMQFDAVLPAVISGKCDIGASGLEYDDAYAGSVTMSDPHMTALTSLAVPAADLPGGAERPDDGGEGDLLDRIYGSVQKNFLQEARWQLIVKGIGTTCLITVLSALFGTLLAFGICLLRRTDSRLAGPVCDAYVHIIQGMPMVVLLMILFYVVFSGSNIEPVWVAVIGLTLSFGAFAAEVMQSGLDGVDPGQEEAALSLGYTRTQAFFRFLFPQAAVRFMPVYRGELVTLLNDTSIVGYIAVQDLTKMSDIIRSRSYEAFLPLIVSTLIYFLLARIITWALDRLQRKIRPRRRTGTAGGDDA
ncbi:MAG: ABC transporter substrate-binding protein/permease [Clostridia bacterium]|nr:ABC transporter substrate-binding protein/permease [Clostridia bacterium]